MEKRILTRLKNVEDALIAIKTDMKWLHWIIVGAAGLGFLEKLAGWIL